MIQETSKWFDLFVKLFSPYNKIPQNQVSTLAVSISPIFSLFWTHINWFFYFLFHWKGITLRPYDHHGTKSSRWLLFPITLGLSIPLGRADQFSSWNMVLLILFIVPIVLQFPVSSLFAEPRAGEARAKRLEEDARNRGNHRRIHLSWLPRQLQQQPRHNVTSHNLAPGWRSGHDSIVSRLPQPLQQ